MSYEGSLVQGLVPTNRATRTQKNCIKSSSAALYICILYNAFIRTRVENSKLSFTFFINFHSLISITTIMKMNECMKIQNESFKFAALFIYSGIIYY